VSKEQLLEILRGDDSDPEAHHGDCDDALLQYINDPEITAAFDDPKKTKWYA
jgi:hypothetical protein